MLAKTCAALQPAQQLTNLADFARLGSRACAASQARHMRSDRTNSPARTAAISDGGSSQQRLHEASASRSASSFAQEKDDIGVTPLAPEYQQFVTGRVDLATVSTALSLLSKDSYFWRGELDGEPQQPPAQEVQTTTPLPQQGLLLKAEQELQQGRWHGSGELGNGAAMQPAWGASAGYSMRASSESLAVLTESVFADGAVEAKSRQRQRYARARGNAWPPVFPERRGERLRRSAAQRATLDAAIDTHGPAAEASTAVVQDSEPDAPHAAAGSDVSRAASAAAEPLGVAVPKQGDEVELVCQSLAYGGKVLPRFSHQLHVAAPHMPTALHASCNQMLPALRSQAWCPIQSPGEHRQESIPAEI